MIINWVYALARFFGCKNISPTWQEIERFDAKWKERIQLMASFICPGEVVLDLGCGPMWLQDFLPEGAEYIAVDYKSRGNHTVICDFNKGEFPENTTDVFFVSGCLEYIIDYQKFIKKICAGGDKCILSYCTYDDFPDNSARRKRGWVNSLSKEDIVRSFKENGMILNHESKTISNNTIFVFIEGKKAKME